MIRDLDVTGPEPAVPGARGMKTVTIVAAVAAVGFIVSVPFWPAAWTPKRSESLLTALASARPIIFPTALPIARDLVLPTDEAEVVVRATYTGDTGLVQRPTGVVTTFRLLESGDLVTVSAIPGADPVRMPSPRPRTIAMEVRGQYAVAVVPSPGVNAVRWTEDNVTYELSSRTLSARDLAWVANGLR